MAKEPEKPRTRTILTGAAQPVSDAVERAHAYFRDRPGPAPAPPRKPAAARKRPPEPAEEEAEETEVAEDLEGEEPPKDLPEHLPEN